MINKTIILKQLKKELPYLSKEFHVTKLGLFGSFARNEQTSKSDVDLLVTFKKGNSSIFNILKLEKYLEKKIKLRIEATLETGLVNQKLLNYIKKDVIYVS